MTHRPRVRAKPFRRGSLGSIALLAAASGLGNAALAETYPNRAIRLIVSSPPAGPTDILARLVGPRLTEAWGQTVVIDNRAGANGMIASELTAKADPDGYTILATNAGFAINTSLYERVQYDPVRQFAPITLAITVPNILVVHPSVPVKSVQDLVALARAKPGQFTFASAGTGSSGHLAVELFQQMSGIKTIHVPYKGGAPALADVIGGQVQGLFSISIAAVPQIKAGKVRALAVTSAKRVAGAPDLPTVAESGFPGYEIVGWFGFVAPAKTPREIVRRLHGEITRILRLPEVQERLADQGAEIVGSTPEAFLAWIKAEQAKWGKVIKTAGIRAD